MDTGPPAIGAAKTILRGSLRVGVMEEEQVRMFAMSKAAENMKG
jgi:hypothetical protein